MNRKRGTGETADQRSMPYPKPMYQMSGTAPSNYAHHGGEDKSSQRSRDDDSSHQLHARPNDILGDRFTVMEFLGRGTFGNVYKCFDSKHQDIVAVKCIRNIEKYQRSAKIESKMLKNIYYMQEGAEEMCVKMYTSFYHRSHYCMVFEPLGKSLLWYIQQNGYHGFPIWYVRDIALQLLSALYFLHDHEMIHTDLKLENILFVTDETMEENFINTKHYLDAMYTAHSHGKLPLPYEQPQSMSEDRLKLPRNLKQEEELYAQLGSKNNSTDNLKDKGSRCKASDKETGATSSSASSSSSSSSSSTLSAAMYSASSSASSNEHSQVDNIPTKISPEEEASLKHRISLRLPRRTRIKLIDFGGSTFNYDVKSAVINTRQYRSPEVIMETDWSYPSDIWSAACIIAEMVSGDLLFATHSNLEHLCMMERVLKDKFPSSLIAASPPQHREKYFFNSADRNISSNSSRENDRYDYFRLQSTQLTSKEDSNVMRSPSLWEICENMINQHGGIVTRENYWDAGRLFSLLSGMLNMKPGNRLTARQALEYSFFDKISESEKNIYYNVIPVDNGKVNDIGEATSQQINDTMYGQKFLGAQNKIFNQPKSAYRPTKKSKRR